MFVRNKKSKNYPDCRVYCTMCKLWLQSCVRVLHYFPLKFRPIMREQLSKAGLNSWPQHVQTTGHKLCSQLTIACVHSWPLLMRTADHWPLIWCQRWTRVYANSWPQIARTADHSLCPQLTTVRANSWSLPVSTADSNRCNSRPQLVRTAHSLCK
jgi:hypothetical protein